MYAPPHFAEHDPAVLADLIRAHPFATLVVNGAEGPVATHVPLAPELSEDGRIAALVGHVARANPFWSAVERAPQALAIFSGTDGYVSPSSYPSKAEHGKVVPTWNYVRIEARGLISLVEDESRLRAIVETLTQLMEARRAKPWSIADAPEAYLSSMLKRIVGFRIAVASLKGARKLSQNKSAEDRAGAAAGLLRDGNDALAAMTADAMRKTP